MLVGVMVGDGVSDGVGPSVFVRLEVTVGASMEISAIIVWAAWVRITLFTDSSPGVPSRPLIHLNKMKNTTHPIRRMIRSEAPKIHHNCLFDMSKSPNLKVFYEPIISLTEMLSKKFQN